MNSFHALINAYSPVDTRLGIDSGKIICRIVCVLLQPSISAASSSARGTVSKKLLIIKVHSGITKVVYARINDI